MIPFKVYNCILVCLLTFCSAITIAQSSLSGTVYDSDNLPLANAEVYITTLGKQTTTSETGNFLFENLKEGTYELVVFTFDFDTYKASITIPREKALKITLTPLSQSLNEVVIIQKRQEQFALKRLKPVEGTAIYAGKKTEVVLLDNLTGNIATNQARQIYAQVVGLNIYENNDAGLQLNIGGRGLNPNRTSNFNTRQNGYDISADVLGYPESYYTPPAEAIQQIEVVRGAASLQYGTQFGGLVNFTLRAPKRDKKIHWTSRQFVGSNNLFTSFNSLSGTTGKVGYYSYFNYKKGNDFRPNSEFESSNAYARLDYEFSPNTKLVGEFTYLYYLAQQPGGLTDRQFEEDPSFSNRTRNWFEVDWKLYGLRWEQKFSERSDFSLQLFALDASRKTVGFRENRVSQIDDLASPRELIVGNFRNWGAEARWLNTYNFGSQENVFLLGAKYYQSRNSDRQGPGSNGMDANFNFADAEFPNFPRQSDFEFPNLNIAIFGEHIFQLSNKFSVTPGFRFENIITESEGTFKNINFDNAGNVILNETLPDNRSFNRSFLLLGVGLSYKPNTSLEAYGNLSQNYRSVTFNDIRITNPSLVIDPNITDEEGFTADLGIRGTYKNILSYDVGAFFLRYEDRLGVVLRSVSEIQQEQFRSNIGDAQTYGFESFIDWNIRRTFSENTHWNVSSFLNFAYTQSEYTNSQLNNVVGNEVEFTPRINLKTGLQAGYKDILFAFQYTYLSRQFTDATNSLRDFDSQSGIIGEIPAYGIADLSVSYTYNRFRLETGVNNLFDSSYFVRRATGYPGPGIIPSQPLTWYAGLQFEL